MKIKKTTHFNGLSEAQAERIALLMEECAEVVQICGKILRHGMESCHPDDAKKTTNRRLLEKEVGHVMFASQLMCKNGDLWVASIEVSKGAKGATIHNFLHHN